MPTFLTDKSLEQLADQLIDQHHSELKMLKIAYLFRAEASVSNSKVVAGMAVRVDDRNWTLHKYDAMIEIAMDVWEQAEPRFREALMDHELSHIAIKKDDDGCVVMDEKTNRIKVFIRPHDIEEFEGVLERHGAYHKDLRLFLDAFTRHKLAKKSSKGDDE